MTHALRPKTNRTADTVRRLVARGARSNALHILNQMHPSEVADVLSQLPVHRQAVFQILAEADPKLAGDTLSELGPARGAELLEALSLSQVSTVLQELDADDAAEFIGQLPGDVQHKILSTMRGRDAVEVQALLQYPEKTAGRIMNPRVFCLPESLTVGEAMERVRSPRDLGTIFYLYVVNENQNLVGVLSLRQLLRNPLETRLRDVMLTDVIRVSTETAQGEVARIANSYNLLAIPIVDAHERLVGVITIDDVIDVLEKEATEDMYRLAGLNVQERVFSPSRTAVRMRMPWLAVNLVTAFLAAFVVSLFEGTIQRFAVLAVFMPVVAGMGGNAGAQTLTVMIRGIALGELSWSNTRKAILKEVSVGVANGLALGCVVALVALAWKGHAVLGIILALAMIGNLLVAAAAGTMVPLILLRLRVDPAIASSVFVTTCTDVFGFFLFLELGNLILKRFT